MSRPKLEYLQQVSKLQFSMYTLLKVSMCMLFPLRDQRERNAIWHFISILLLSFICLLFSYDF